MSSYEDADVRVLLLGEPGVGKTSLLYSLVEDEFLENVPPRGQSIIIPGEVTPDNVSTLIVDYCSTEQDETALRLEISEASVLCVVYDVNDEATLDQVNSKWIPMIRQVLGEEHERPVILVGNKSDGPDNHVNQVLPIMEKWSEVETSIECSAKSLKNVSEVFFYSQKAVICPTRPLYNAEEKALTNKCKKALIRVFKVICFGIPLTSAAIEDVKSVISDGAPDGILHDAISLKGFLYLHQLFVERGRHETTWSILHKFGYNEHVKLCEDYVYPKIQVPMGSSTELSPEGIQFVSALFQKFDQDMDGALSPSELSNLFSICPTGSVMRDMMLAVETNQRGWITYAGYMGYWQSVYQHYGRSPNTEDIMTTLVNVTQTLELLAHLGFAVGRGGTTSKGARTTTEGFSVKDAIRITRDRKVDLMEKGTDRKVFQCLVVGAKDAGKTVFMQSLAGRNRHDAAMIGRRSFPYVINRISVKEDMKYLLLREVDVLSPQDVLSAAETSADVVCFLYDTSNPESFGFAATTYLKHFHRKRTPCVMVATKVEREEVEQRWETQPADFCRAHELPRPLRFSHSMIGVPGNPIFTQLATMAVYPHLRKVYFLNDTSIVSKIGVGAAIATLAAFLVYRNL